MVHALEELMHGLAWPAVARARHRPQKQSCDEYDDEYEYEYPISSPLFIGIEEADYQLAAQHTNCMQCIPIL
jgi:hypothetical protein